MKIVPIPLLKDNYAYIVTDLKTNTSALIDPGEADPVLKYLNQNQISIKYIFNTHHHWDHVDGNLEIKLATQAKVVGSAHEKKRIPGIDLFLSHSQKFKIGELEFEVIDAPGHTQGHQLYYFKDQSVLFTGDVLFAMGCGRLFEGTAEQMFHTFQIIKSLPRDTLIYCGHEYAVKNSQFALTCDAQNLDLIQRAQNPSGVPFSLELELKTNPFLRAKTVDEFSKLRLARDIY